MAQPRGPNGRGSGRGPGHPPVAGPRAGAACRCTVGRMREITDRALDTGPARGAPTRTCGWSGASRSPSTSRRAAGRCLRRRVGGLRRPRHRGRGLGIRQQPRPLAGRGGPRCRLGRADRARERHGAPARRSSSPTGRSLSAASRRPSRRTPSPSPWTQDRAPARRRRARCDAVDGHRLRRHDLRRPARVEDVRGQRRQLHGAGHHPRRRGHRGQRGRRRRAAAAQLPGHRRRLAGRAGYEFIRGLDLAGNAERVASEAVELLSAPQLPAGTPDDHPRPVAAVHADPRELRPPDRARPRLRDRGELRRDQLPDDRQGSAPGSATAARLVDIVADATVAGRHGHLRLGRRGRRRRSAVPLVKEGIFVGYLSSRETAPRIGRASGGAMRADGWNRIPLIRMTNINLLPKPGMSLRRHHRRHRRRAPASTPTGAGRSTTGASTSSSPPRCAARSRAASWAGCTATPPTPASRRSSGARATPSATQLSCVMLGTPNCGKGEPAQAGHVGHGCSGARFRNVQVGVVAVSASRDRRAPPAEALPARGGGRPAAIGRGRDRGRGAGRRGGSRAHALRQQRDPPERRRDEVRVNLAPCWEARRRREHRAHGRRRPAVAGRGRRRIARLVEERRTGRACPSRAARRARRPPGRRAPPSVAGAAREGARAVIAAADAAGVTAFGSFSTGVEAVAVANSQGDRPAERRTSSQLLVVTMGPDDGTGYAEAAAVDATPIDGRASGARRPSKPARRPSGGTCRPATTRSCSRTTRSSTCSTCSGTWVSAPRGRGGPLVLRGGQARRERPRHDPRRRRATRRACPRPSTTRGSQRAVSLIEAGVCRYRRARLRDGGAGRRADHRPRASRPQPVGPLPLHWRWPPAPRRARSSSAGSDRGLLVTRFHYTNPVHAKLRDHHRA